LVSWIALGPGLKNAQFWHKFLEGFTWGPKWVCFWNALRVQSPWQEPFKLRVKW